VRNFSVIWTFLKLKIRKITTLIKKIFSKEVVIFLIFLLISIFFWVLQSLQSVTDFELTVPITYSKIPDSLVISSGLPDEFKVTLRDRGTLMYYYYKHLKDLSLHIDPMEWYRGEGVNKIPSGTLETRIRYKLRSSTQLLSINPDTISILFVEKAVKRVPVSLRQNVRLAPQFMMIGNPVITPSSIIVYASQGRLNKIDSIDTDLLEIMELSDTATYKINLKPVKGVRFSQNSVKVSFQVEEFTERSIMVPVKGYGFPLDEDLLSFPSKVRLSFFVGLSKYSEVNENDFQVSVFYDKLIESKDKMQKLVVTKFPAWVQNIRVQPEEVDCLIERK
jgi:YbbR domain-containing protein